MQYNQSCKLCRCICKRLKSTQQMQTFETSNFERDGDNASFHCCCKLQVESLQTNQRRYIRLAAAVFVIAVMTTTRRIVCPTTYNLHVRPGVIYCRTSNCATIGVMDGIGVSLSRVCLFVFVCLLIFYFKGLHLTCTYVHT